MADINKIKLPSGSEYNLKDYRIPGVDTTPTSGSNNVVTSGGVYNSIKDFESFYFVQGSSSAAGNSTSGSYLSTKWEGTVPGVSTATNGLKIAYRIATNTGVSTAGVVLSIDGTNYYPVVIQKNTLVTSYYPVGTTVLMVFNSTQTATAYLTSNTKSTVTGCWQIMEYDSNSDTKQREYLSSDNVEYPITTRYATTSGSSYYAEYGRYSEGVTLNPSTNTITASAFKVDDGTSSQVLKADGSLGAIDSTPTANSSNLVTSGGVRDAIDTAIGSVYRVKGTKATYTELPSSGNVAGDVWNVTAAYDNYPAGTNWVWTGSAWDALGGEIDLSGKQDVLTFDSTPTANSTNPVTSGGVYQSVIDASLVTSAALNDLNTRVETIEGQVQFDTIPTENSTNAVTSGGIYNTIDEIEEVTATALNNLNDRINSVQSDLDDIDTPGTLNTTATTALSTATNEALSGGISLHKIAKTGTYSDLIDKPTAFAEILFAGGIRNVANDTYPKRILFSSANDSKWVPANNNSAADYTSVKTVTQTPINPFGEIVYYGGTTNLYVATSAAPEESKIYSQTKCYIGYSFCPTASYQLSIAKPVYVKCAPQSDGSAIIDSTNPIVQSLPSSEDGKIYIYLGMSGGLYSLGLSYEHPVYYYSDGAIRQWTNVTESTVSGWGFTKNTGTLTGVSFNGTAATVTNGVASITAPQQYIIEITESYDSTTDTSTYNVTFGTWSEILTAHSSGIPIVLKITFESGNISYVKNSYFSYADGNFTDVSFVETVDCGKVSMYDIYEETEQLVCDYIFDNVGYHMINADYSGTWNNHTEDRAYCSGLADGRRTSSDPYYVYYLPHVNGSITNGGRNIVKTLATTDMIPQILSGTSDPASSLGNNGDIYIKLSS